MRGKKGEDLIWNGSREMARYNRAVVKLVFDNNKKIFPVDFDEVIIERVVHRDGVNEYMINGSPTRLRDIIELLANANIGSSGHHIISQGEADKILNSSTKDRKEMVEDALGLKIYQYKKQESEKKLLKTRDNITQIESLCREISPHLKFLKKQVEKIEQTEKIRDELKVLYHQYLKRENIYLKNKKEDLTERKKEFQDEFDSLEKRHLEISEILLRSESEDPRKEEAIELGEKSRNARINYENIVRDLGRIEGEIKALERRLNFEKEKKINQSLSIPIEEIEEINSGLKSGINSAKGSFDEIRTVIKDVISKIQSIINKYKSGVSEDFIEGLESEIKILKKNKEGLSNRKNTVEKERNEIDSKKNLLLKQIDENKDSRHKAEKDLFRLESGQSELSSKIQIIESEERTLSIEDEDFKRELTEGSVLIGMEILKFESFPIKDSKRENVLTSEVILEDRKIQIERRKKIEKIKIRIEDRGEGGGEDISREYKETTERIEFLTRELSDLEISVGKLDDLIKELGQKIEREFSKGVEKINVEFQKFFSLMFGGGEAKLVKSEKLKVYPNREAILGVKSMGDIEGLDLEDSENVTKENEEGLEVFVNLPRKKIKGLVMLSGGERALTSIALIFAMSQVNPPPFIILDETDAALDEANSRKYGDMIENLSKHSQLILITHNRETMSRAGIIYGVTMDKMGISKLLSIAFDEAVEVAK